jgi:hypothetical protein
MAAGLVSWAAPMPSQTQAVMHRLCVIVITVTLVITVITDTLVITDLRVI